MIFVYPLDFICLASLDHHGLSRYFNFPSKILCTLYPILLQYTYLEGRPPLSEATIDGLALIIECGFSTLVLYSVWPLARNSGH